MKNILTHILPGGKILILAGVASYCAQTLQATSSFVLSDSESKAELTLLVYKYSDFSTRQIRDTKAWVVLILDNAGIRTKWLDCRPRSEKQKLSPACGQPPGPSQLVVRLVDRPATSKPVASRTTLGHSFAAEDGGSYAMVYCAPIALFASGDKSSEAAYLGHAIAHEIGHLLLGPNAHSSSGIMMAHWGKKELRQIATGQQGLLFSKEQAKRLRISLSARQRREEGNQGARLNGQF